MGFKFSDHSVKVEIEDKEYSLKMGDAERLGKINEWAKKLVEVDYDNLNERTSAQLQNSVKQNLIGILGKEQYDDIAASRKDMDLIDMVELFAYLWYEVNNSSVLSGMNKKMAQYLPDTTE